CRLGHRLLRVRGTPHTPRNGQPGKETHDYLPISERSQPKGTTAAGTPLRNRPTATNSVFSAWRKGAGGGVPPSGSAKLGAWVRRDRQEGGVPIQAEWCGSSRLGRGGRFVLGGVTARALVV